MKPVKLSITTHSRPQTMLGVSLIELMISLTIGLIIIAAIGYAYLASRQSFRTQDVLGRMQEDARSAFEMMSKDIRMAGFNGCQTSVPNPLTFNPQENNVINVAQPKWYQYWYPALLGYENTNEATISISPANPAPATFPADLNGLAVSGVAGNVLQGDVLTVKYADISQPYVVTGFAGNQITLNTAPNFSAGEILISVHPLCTGFDILKYTGVNGKVITYDTTKGPATNTVTTSGGSTLYPVKAVTYYIKFNANGNPALYREFLVTNPADGAVGTVIAQEMIEGIQDMQLGFGVVNANNPTAVTGYVTANNVTANNGVQAAIDWLNVVGVRVSMLMVSRQSEQGITTQGQPYSLDMNANGTVNDAGETINNPGDLLFRKRFTTTIAVENRL